MCFSLQGLCVEMLLHVFVTHASFVTNIFISITSKLVSISWDTVTDFTNEDMRLYFNPISLTALTISRWAWCRNQAMFDSIVNNTFSYYLTLDEFRDSIPEDIRPSWVKLTTITMVSSFNRPLDINRLRLCFEKISPIRIRMSGKKSEGYEWTLKPTTFYNQITLCYKDMYSVKSIKLFPNGSIQVRGVRTW